MRAVLYARVSTQTQATDGDSLEAQDASMRAWCQARGYEVVTAYVEVASGGDWERPQLQQMLHAVDASPTKPWDVLVSWRADRLARSPRDLEEVVGRLLDRGIQFHSVNEPELSGHQGELLRPVIAFAAAWERRAIGQRVKQSVIQRQEAGTYLTPHPPYGYAYRAKAQGGPAWDACEAEAMQLRWLFEAYLELGSANAVAKALNAKGWTTRKGRPWWPGDVIRLVQQQAYIGTLVVGLTERVQQGRKRFSKPADPSRRREFPGAVPALVSQQVWAQANALMQSRKSTAPRRVAAMGTNPWAGRVWCTCGSSMVLDTREASRGRSARLNCRASALGSTCTGGSFALHHLHSLVLPLVRDLVQQARWGKAPVSAAKVARNLQTERRALQARFDRAWEAYERGLVDIARFERTKAEVDEQLRALDEVATLAPKPLPKLDGDFSTWWSAAPVPLRGQLLKDLGVRVTWARTELRVELAPLSCLDPGPHAVPLPVRRRALSQAKAQMPAWVH